MIHQEDFQPEITVEYEYQPEIGFEVEEDEEDDASE